MTGGANGGGDLPEQTAEYSEAIAAIAARDGEAAARLLRGLLTADRRERPGYLPHFYYGQALAALGQCEEALKSFDESERQGVIAGQPEAASLPAARAQCASAPELPDVETPLRQVESTLATLDAQIAELEGTRASAEVARIWKRLPPSAATSRMRGRRCAAPASSWRARAPGATSASPTRPATSPPTPATSSPAYCAR